MNERLSDDAKAALLREVPLIDAAIQRILRTVDDSFHECSTCQMKIRHTFRDHQLSENLGSARRKLRGWEEEAGGRPKDSNQNAGGQRVVQAEPADRAGDER